MASTTSRRGWASGRPPAAGVLVDLLVWLPKSLPGALFAAQTARHPAVTATVQPSAKAAQPTGSETGTKGLSLVRTAWNAEQLVDRGARWQGSSSTPGSPRDACHR